MMAGLDIRKAHQFRAISKRSEPIAGQEIVENKESSAAI